MSIGSRLFDLAVRAMEGTAERGAASEAAQARRLAIKRAAREVEALPPPAKPLALPKPAPKLPAGASKPRGGQWHPDTPLGAPDARTAGFSVRDRGAHAHPDTRYQVVRPEGRGAGQYRNAPDAWAGAERTHQHDISHTNLSPEAAARDARRENSLVGLYQQSVPNALGDWLEKSYAKYLRNDFGAPEDPLRSLAARGMHYDPEMTPERWADEVNSSLYEDPIGYYTVPRHSGEIQAEHNPLAFTDDLQGDLDSTAHALEPGVSHFGNAHPAAQGALMQAAPWLRKQPATDMLYGLRGTPDIGHFTDEMLNALNHETSGLPRDLAVRPESLSRMSFPQAVEHVGRINQWRAAEMEKAQQGMLDHPAVQMFKEYPENNPSGLRWVELRAPELPEGYHIDPATGEIMTAHGSNGPVGGSGDPRRPQLQEVLQQEGDAMGHCVGGYCPDVMAGRSRIFSLRDAKGSPHVTIETAPRQYRFSDVVGAVGQRTANEWLRDFTGTEGALAAMVDRAGLREQAPQDIVQIKGKQNRAPNAEYLPFVQDFVKSGQWGKVGDLANTGLTQLPGKRYINTEDFNNVVRDNNLNDLYQSFDFNARGFPHDPANMSPEDWDQFSHHFEGYKRGGLAVKRGCGCAACEGKR